MANRYPLVANANTLTIQELPAGDTLLVDNLTSLGVSNLGPVGNVIITGGSNGQYLSTDGNGVLSWSAGGGGGTALTVSEANANAGNITNATSNVSGILFDKDSGFTVSNVGNGNVLIQLGSTFKTWVVDGQPNLVAQGEDTVQFIAGNNISILTSNTPSPPGQPYKYIEFNADVSFVSNGTSNINIPTNGNIEFSVDGNANVVSVTSTGIVTGNGSGGNISGANVISANTLSISGNATVGNIITGNGTGGNISGANVISANTLSISGNATVSNLNVNTIIANRSNTAVTTNTVIDQFSPSSYRSAKYVISVQGDNGYQSVETLLVHDGTNSYITIYASICSNISANIIDLSSNINGTTGNVSLYATTASTNTVVKIIPTYLKP